MGFDYAVSSCVKAKSNMKSALENEEDVDEYLGKEVGLSWVIGPLEPGLLPAMQINRFGVIPKNHQPGKWRLIVDLSHPVGASVNEGIEPELCSLKYSSVDEAVKLILQQGQAAELAKLDI